MHDDLVSTCLRNIPLLFKYGMPLRLNMVEPLLVDLSPLTMIFGSYKMLEPNDEIIVGILDLSTINHWNQNIESLGVNY